MVRGFGGTAPPRFSRGHRISKPLACLAVLAAIVLLARHLPAQDEGPPIDDITAKYHFLAMDDTLAILDEEGRLKGYIEAAQPEEESDDFLNYDIVDGSRKKNHVEFRTNKIHAKFFRFSGTVERGKGHEEKDADYLHLTGKLEIVTVNMETGKEKVQVVQVTFKSIGKSERPED
jgi:hypothetical protein